jgi:hypothetical protein
MNDLTGLREAARAMRMRVGFEPPYGRFNGKSGKWLTGSRDDEKELNGRRVLVDCYNAVIAWEKFGTDKKPIYVSAGCLADRHQPPPREQLGDHDQREWYKGIDPWTLKIYAALFDPETRERFVFSTPSASGRDATGVLLEAYCDHNNSCEVAQWPLAELGAESFVSSFGEKNFKPMFDILDWLEPPNDFLVKVLKPPVSIPLSALPKLTPPTGSRGRAEMDDEIPF